MQTGHSIHVACMRRREIVVDDLECSGGHNRTRVVDVIDHSIETGGLGKVSCNGGHEGGVQTRKTRRKI